VGRIVPVGCTGWIISNGAYLTAGHCTGSSMDILEFNVPDSLSNGTIVHPGVEDQYPIIAASVEFRNTASPPTGDDWAIFNCSPNATTGLTAALAQGAFVRISKDYPPGTTTDVRITGYGVDGPSPNFGDGGPRNADNQTEQTHYGPYLGETDAGSQAYYHRYRVDTQPASSGSPIFVYGTTLSIGIHTNGGCTSSGGANAGTSFENNYLDQATREFFGANVRHVDVGHPNTTETGSVLLPYSTVVEGTNAVPDGGTVSIVAGSYTAAGGNTMTLGDDGKAMTLTAPVGTVTIGQ
jgi:hypothetical protein